MPIPSLSSIQGNTVQELIDSIERQRKELEWLLSGSLDTQNVKEINADVLNAGTVNANLVTIRSDLTGNSYLQLDGNGIRAVDSMGLVGFEIDNTGHAYFRGDITSEATITGAVLRSGPVGSDRIELSGGAFRGITSGGSRTGLYFDISSIASTGIADIYLYHNGVPLVEFYDDITGYRIRGTSSSTGMTLGGNYATTYAEGTWDFSTAYKVGLDHNHGIADGTKLLKGYYDSTSGWVITGSVTFLELNSYT